MSPKVSSSAGGLLLSDERPERCRERILLWEVGAEAWVVATPDEELEEVDMNAADLKILLAGG